MGYSIDIDWREEFNENCDKWINHTEQILRTKCNHTHESYKKSDEDKCSNMEYQNWCEECDVYEDSCEPMMNYGYPLETEPSEEDIKECYEETGLVVMEDTINENYYLVLTGGGMDLSQNIGLAYVIIENWIPKDLMDNICTQKGLSLSDKKFERLQIAVIEQLKNYEDNFKSKRKEWEKK